MVQAQTKRLVVRVVTDILIIALLHASYFIIKASGSSRLRISCQDNSIRYPYYSDTISILGCAFYSYLLPILSIVLLEVLLAIYNYYALEQKAWKVMGFLMYNFIITFLMAAGVCFMLTNLIKYTLGRARPHFWDVCKPNLDPRTCVGYQNSYTCQGTNKKALDDVFKSFVSGHSSLSAVGTTYAVLYLQERLHLKPAPMVRPLIQVAYVCAGVYIAMSRFTDHKHHPWDIISGVLLGTSSAFVLFFRYLPKMMVIQ